MSKSSLFLFFFLLLLQTTLSLPKSLLFSKLRSHKQTRPPYHKVSLYFNSVYESTKSSSICQIPGDKIDRLYYGYLTFQSGICKFSKPDSEFYLGPKSGLCGDTPQTTGDAFYGDMYQLLKFKERFPHVKVFASLGGPFYSSSVTLHNTILSTAGVNAVANSCVSLFKQYSSIFDGFDLDLEFPCVFGDKKCGPNGYYYPASNDDKTAFTAFIVNLKNQLGSTIPLSIVVSADTTKLNSIDFPAINPFIDHYNIKNYDITAGNFGDSFTGFHTFLGPTLADPLASRILTGGYQAMRYLLTKGVLAGKINMGSPFHGRGFQVIAGTTDASNGFMTASGGLKTAKYEENVYDYREIKKILTGSNSFYNYNAQAAYMYEKSTGVFICYESVQSAVAKVSFVKRNGLQGVVAWEFAGDTSDSELLTALNQNPM